MTRMIERWFPCQEVSDNSARGWGSGNSEVMLFPWFAKRPLAQAKAAVLTSLLPWPDDAIEQARLQDLVRNAMKGRDAENGGLVVELARQFPERQRLLDPFSGRAMIPLEAAHLAIRTFGVDYSPVAAVAGRLLVDYPLRDFSKEPELGYGRSLLLPRLPQDVEHFLSEVKAPRLSGAGAVLPRGRGQATVGVPVVYDASVSGVRKPFPAYRLPDPSPAKSSS